jgi:hypothetical protein
MRIVQICIDHFLDLLTRCVQERAVAQCLGSNTRLSFRERERWLSETVRVRPSTSMRRAVTLRECIVVLLLASKEGSRCMYNSSFQRGSVRWIIAFCSYLVHLKLLFETFLLENDKYNSCYHPLARRPLHRSSRSAWVHISCVALAQLNTRHH